MDAPLSYESKIFSMLFPCRKYSRLIVQLMRSQFVSQTRLLRIMPVMHAERPPRPLRFSLQVVRAGLSARLFAFELVCPTLVKKQGPRIWCAHCSGTVAPERYE